MTIEKQVLSIPQMKELEELGIDTYSASMYSDSEVIKSYHFWDINGASYPVFTLQDILEMLPKPCYINCIDEDFYQCEVTTNNGSLSTNGKTAMAAAFEMLKWCKQNNYI